MSRLDIYKKQAKQLVRWHRAGNYSIGGRIRGLARYQTLTDREALALEFPLREAQEIGELRGFQRGQHGAQAVGAFRMIGAGVVPQAVRMRDQRCGHVSLPPPSLRRCGG